MYSKRLSLPTIMTSSTLPMLSFSSQILLKNPILKLIILKTYAMKTPNINSKVRFKNKMLVWKYKYKLFYCRKSIQQNLKVSFVRFVELHLITTLNILKVRIMSEIWNSARAISLLNKFANKQRNTSRMMKQIKSPVFQQRSKKASLSVKKKVLLKI